LRILLLCFRQMYSLPFYNIIVVDLKIVL
jgi:hypothetical protein